VYTRGLAEFQVDEILAIGISSLVQK